MKGSEKSRQSLLDKFPWEREETENNQSEQPEEQQPEPPAEPEEPTAPGELEPPIVPEHPPVEWEAPDTEGDSRADFDEDEEIDEM